VDDWVRAPETGVPTNAVTNVTILAWIKLNSLPVKGTFVKIGVNGYGIGMGNPSWDYAGYRLSGVYEAVRWIDSGYDFPSTGWYHVGFVIDADGQPNFYVNGSFISKVAGSTPLVPTGISGIGGYTTSRFFNGLIDDVRIYNRALSPSEVSLLYKGFNPISISPGGLWSGSTYIVGAFPPSPGMIYPVTIVVSASDGSTYTLTTTVRAS
jgi:hypothetical protein